MCLCVFSLQSHIHNNGPVQHKQSNDHSKFFVCCTLYGGLNYKTAHTHQFLFMITLTLTSLLMLLWGVCPLLPSPNSPLCPALQLQDTLCVL